MIIKTNYQTNLLEFAAWAIKMADMHGAEFEICPHVRTVRLTFKSRGAGLLAAEVRDSAVNKFGAYSLYDEGVLTFELD